LLLALTFLFEKKKTFDHMILSNFCVSFLTAHFYKYTIQKYFTIILYLILFKLFSHDNKIIRLNIQMAARIM